MVYTRRMSWPLVLGLMVLTVTVGCGQERAGAEAAGQALELDDAPDAEWIELFDGESLQGWTSRGEGAWTVEDGSITTVPGTGGGFLVTIDDFQDFRMQVEFWADTAANGGVFFGVPATGEINATNSFEVNIFDAHADWPTGSISGLHRHDGPQTVGRWSTLDMTVQDDRVIVSLDGERTADVRASRDSAGRIALQHYLGDGMIRYRSVRLLNL